MSRSPANVSVRPVLAALMLRASGLALAGLGAGALTAVAAAHEPETAVAPAPTGISAWGIASADLPADPSVRFGVLPNGMRYALKHNETPKSAAVIRFAFDGGMRDVVPSQFGVPHYLEHMAFNGSTNMAEGQLIKQLERLGLAFGADTNAETDLEHTTYKLDLPNLNPETLDAGLTFMREIASELTLDATAVERERGVILAESSARNVPQLRRLLDVLGKGMPGTRFGPGITGMPATVSTITAEQLRAFYQGFYRPERATLVMVGDFDVDAMETMVRARFSDWKAEGPAGVSYVPDIVAGSQTASATFSDPNLAEIIQFDRVSPYRAPDNTLQERLRKMLEAIASTALSNRFNALARKADSPLLGGQAGIDSVGRSARTATAFAVAKDGMWREALALGEQQLRQAREYGFTAGEIAEAKANIKASLENAVRQETGRSSAAIADSLATGSLADAIVLSPSANLALYTAIEPGLTAEAASHAFRDAWASGPTLVHVATKLPIAKGDTAVAAALAESTKIAVAAPVEEATKAFAYDDFGPAGMVVSDKTIADLNIRTVRFANGVELNLKKTDFEPGKITWYSEIGAGLRVLPADKPGLSSMIPFATSVGGLQAHTIDELRRITAGRQVGLGISVGEDALIASGGTTPADLELQLKLLAAQITAPAYDPATQAQWAAIAPVASKNILGNPAQLAGLVLPYIVSGNDGRFGLSDPAALTRLSLDDARAVLSPQLASGGIELGLIGDIDEDAAIAAVAATLGALPLRGTSGTEPASVVPVTMTTDRTLRTVYHEGAPDQGVITLAWPTTDDSDFKNSLTRDLLAGVFQLRLTDVLREELGATYSPGASSYDSSSFEGYGYLTASATAGPDAMDQIAAAIRQIAGDLRTGPASADELLRARQPVLERWQRQLRENGSWAGLVAGAQSEPERLDRRRQRSALLQSITAIEIQAAAKRYLDSAGAIELRVVPKPAP